jgi:hypothetical protein
VNPQDTAYPAFARASIPFVNARRETPMRFTILLVTMAVLLIADQVRTGGYYRHQILDAIEQIAPKSAARVLAVLY